MNAPLVRNSKLDKSARIWNDSQVIDSTIGKYSYVSDHTSIYYAKIGKFCSIASYVSIGGAAHPTQFVSSSPIFLKGRNPFRKNLAELDFDPYKTTVIGNDVWIGTHSMIKSGVRISDGAVIGMGSVVLHDVGPYEVWAGNPARFIKKRFTDDEIKKLLEWQWWNCSDEELKKIGTQLDKIDICMREVQNGKI